MDEPMYYPFEKDPFPGTLSYYFTNRFNDKYEVSFSRSSIDYLHVTVSFCVTNEEYDKDAYCVTNKGDIYRVLNTVCLIILRFSIERPNIHLISFAGERQSFEDEKTHPVTIRTRVFMRFVKKYFPPPMWKVVQEGNYVHIHKIENS
jgi:hypothetical protein